MEIKRFQRKKEDFVCGHCGQKVKGSGYTNHCPYCLWSKHMDVNPGDRADECGGLMRPVDIYKEGNDWIIVHRCEKCGEKRKKKTDEVDDTEAIIKLQNEINYKKTRQ